MAHYDAASHIANFAGKNDELLATLSQTDYAAGAHKQQQDYLANLNNELKQADRQVSKLSTKTRLEKYEFEHIRDSTSKRFLYKVSGQKEKYASKTEKEEKEYLEALEAEKAARDRSDVIKSAVQEATAVLDRYQADIDLHSRTQRELDSLYDMLFNGPTPQFVDEDHAEYAFNQARDHFNSAEQQWRTLEQTKMLFDQMANLFTTATKEMDRARDASQWDMWGGGTSADMIERNALSGAQSAMVQIKALIDQVKLINPAAAPDLGPVKIAQGSVWGDILFDNFLSDYSFHQDIKDSQRQVEQAKRSFGVKHAEVQQFHATQSGLIENERLILAQARRRLQDTRSHIFAQVKALRPAPPAYTA